MVEVKTGRDHFELVWDALPEKYQRLVDKPKYSRGGATYEAIVEKILQNEFGDKVSRPGHLLSLNRGERQGGYLKPDLCVKERNYVEVTGWADSNMVLSKIMQGFLIKEIHRTRGDGDASYFVVIADLGLDRGWSWDDNATWEAWSQIREVKAVDGWFGMKDVKALLKSLSERVYATGGR